jgi:predicted TIM-barrel fold metal-dependent hydrolase
MKIIDAHTHVFEYIAGFGAKGELRSIGGGKARWANGDEIAMIPPELGDRTFTPEALVRLMDENNVEKSVLLQGSFYGFQNEYTYEAVQHYPDRFVGAATFDPFCKGAMQLLHRFLYELKFSIVKFETSSGGGLMGYHKDYKIDGDVFAEILDEIAAAGATLVIDIGGPGMASFQPQAVANVAKKHPGMKLVVCHLLAPKLGDRDELETGLKLLKLDNVWLDLAAIPWNVAPEVYPYPTGLQYISLAKSIVSAKKLIWGSDVPSPLTRDSYAHLINYITSAEIFTVQETEDVFYNNAKSVYSL